MLLLFPFVLVSVSLVANHPVGAVEIKPEFCATNSDPAVCNVDIDQTATQNVLVGSEGLITRGAQALVWASGIVAMILIIIAGFMFIFSQGNSESVGRARSTVIYAVIGMAIAVVGQAIVSFVLVRLS